MNLTAWKIGGPAYTWEEVEAWVVAGTRLTIRRNLGRYTVEEVRLPADIIGFTDDAPARLVAESSSSGYQPSPAKMARQAGGDAVRRPRIVDRFDSDQAHNTLHDSLPAYLRERGAGPKRKDRRR